MLWPHRLNDSSKRNQSGCFESREGNEKRPQRDCNGCLHAVCRMCMSSRYQPTPSHYLKSSSGRAAFAVRAVAAMLEKAAIACWLQIPPTFVLFGNRFSWWLQVIVRLPAYIASGYCLTSRTEEQQTVIDTSSDQGPVIGCSGSAQFVSDHPVLYWVFMQYNHLSM